GLVAGGNRQVPGAGRNRSTRCTRELHGADDRRRAEDGRESGFNADLVEGVPKGGGCESGRLEAVAVEQQAGFRDVLPQVEVDTDAIAGRCTKAAAGTAGVGVIGPL